MCLYLEFSLTYFQMSCVFLSAIVFTFKRWVYDIICQLWETTSVLTRTPHIQMLIFVQHVYTSLSVKTLYTSVLIGPQ